MNQHIHCIVNDCHYWVQGNKCVANEVLIVTDEFGAAQPDRIDATKAKELTPEPAANCMYTCCKTYVTKRSPDTNSDGVTKLP